MKLNIVLVLFAALIMVLTSQSLALATTLLSFFVFFVAIWRNPIIFFPANLFFSPFVSYWTVNDLDVAESFLIGAYIVFSVRIISYLFFAKKRVDNKLIVLNVAFVLFWAAGLLSVLYETQLSSWIGLFMLSSSILFAYLYVVTLSEAKSSSSFREFIISTSLVVLMVFIVALASMDGLAEIYRLSVDRRPRAYANVFGIVLVLLLVCAKDFRKAGAGRFAMAINVAAVLTCILALVMTQSRGALFGAVLAIILYYLLEIFRNRQFKPYSVVKFGAAVFTFVLVVLLVLPQSLLENMGKRLSESGSGTSVRFEIWKSGFSRVDLGDIWLGGGTGFFQQNASESGMDYYAHSVFVDVLFSFGILPFLIMTLSILCLFFIFVLRHKHKQAAIAGYLILSYVSHGFSIQTVFWISLGLVAVVTLSDGFTERSMEND